MTRISLLRFHLTAVFTLLAGGATLAYAQTLVASPAVSSSSVAAAEGNPAFAPDTADTASIASENLPDAPSAAASAGTLGAGSYVFAAQPTGTATPTVAPRLTKYIPSGWTAQTINGHDKVLLGLRDLYSPLNFLAMVASAGYEHALNGEPNYGTDRGAFGQRLGAAAIRESTQGLFTDAVFAPLLRQDPRYYVQGPSHNFIYRAAYAATRPLITRTDGGHSTVNGALLAGYASSAALSYTYYPQINRNFHDTASTFAGSLGGAALGFFVSEFSDDLLKAIHMRKK